MKRYVIAMAGAAALSVAIAGCGSNPSTTTASKNVFTTIDEQRTITAGAPLNPFNTSGDTFPGYDQWQLAWFTNSLTNPNRFIPGLAAKWQVNSAGTQVTVTLQPGAKWSNGKPVTANDVLASMAIAFTQGTAQGYDLGSVKAINDHTVQFTQLPGDHYNLFANQLLQSTIVPESEFVSVLPKNIWQIINTAQYAGSNNAKLNQAKAAANQLTTIGKKIAAYAPPKSEDLSAGPFVLKSLNTGEAVLVKNPDFYAKQNVHVDQVVLRNYTGNQQIWNYLESGQLDFAPYTSMPTNIVNQILKTKGNQKVVTPAVVSASLAFDQNVYPYGMTSVRQALAYLINRSEVQKIGEPTSGTPTQWPDGMIDAATKKWLSSSQLASLNTYPTSTKKATQLLTSAGFKKVNGKWMMPNGKPWTATIYVVNGFSDWIAASKVISTEMTNFGIPTAPSIVSSFAQEIANQEAGDYGTSFYLDALGPTPANAYDRIYGTPDGYNLVGTHLVHYAASAKGKGNWIDAPATMPTGTGQSINPGQLTNALPQLSTAAQQAPLVNELAQATDTNLPVLTLWNTINLQFVNTTRFTDFPVHSDALMYNAPGVWMAQGYVKPKK